MKKFSDRKFLISIIAVSVAIKAVMMVVYFHVWLLNGHADIIGPDGEGYSHSGWYIAKVLAGGKDLSAPTKEYVFKDFHKSVENYQGKLPPFNGRTNGLYAYAAGVLYYIFGYVPLLVKSCNILFSALTSLVVFLMASRLYNGRVARIATVAFTFFPSVFLFSITALREPLIILCVTTALYMLIRMAGTVRYRDAAVLAVSLALILFLRQELFLIVSGLVLALVLVQGGLRYKIAVASIIGAALVIVTGTPLFSKINFAPATLVKDAAAVVFSKNYTSYNAGGRLAYAIFPREYYDTYRKYGNRDAYLASHEKLTMRQLVRYLPEGIIAYLVRPVPFVRSDTVYFALSWYSLCWYAVLALSLVGVFRKRNAPAYPIFLFMAVLILASCMGEANEGILLRHRDSLVPFIVLFASAALERQKTVLSGRSMPSPKKAA